MNSHAACATQLNMSFAFGGPAWPIDAADLTFIPLWNGQCRGAIFDLTGPIQPRPGAPTWVFGDAFLVRFFASLVLKTGFA
jgi:hypothetical protein